MGACGLSVRWPLSGQTLARVGLAHPALAQARDLHLRRADSDDHAIEIVVVACLEQQRHIDDGKRVLVEPLEPADAGRDRAIARRMHDRYEVAPRGGIGKHDRTERRAVHRSVWRENLAAESFG